MSNMLWLKTVTLTLTIALFYLFLASPSNLLAQSPSLKNYNTTEGLPSYETYMTIQDRNGYIWVATNYGVSRFDGYKFETFTTNDGLPDNTIFELFEDSKGRIWFVTSNLQFSYWYKGKIHQYKYNKEISNHISFTPHIENRCFYVDNNDNLYFSLYSIGAFIVNAKGTIRFFKKTKKNSTSLLKITPTKYIISQNNPSPSSLFYEWNKTTKPAIINKLPILCYVNIMILFSKKKTLYYTQDRTVFVITNSGVIQYTMPDFIISLDQDNSGNIWVGLRSNGALCYKNGDFKKQPFLHVLKGMPVSHIFSDTEGGLWFSTLSRGIFYTPNLNILNYTIEDGLISNQINKISKFASNELAVFSNTNTYSLIKNQKILQIKESIPKDEQIKFAIKTTYQNWISTNKMLYISDKNNTHTLAFVQKYKKNISIFSIKNKITPKLFEIFSILDILSIDSNLNYIIKSSEIFKQIKNELTRVPRPYTNPKFTNLTSDNNNTIYFGSKIGPGYIEGDSMKMLYNQYPQLKTRTNFVLYVKPDSSLWIATKGDGIYIIKNNQLNQITLKDGLCSNNIKHLYLNKNEIWVSTNAGINRINLKKSKLNYQITRINSTMGLISNDVAEIAVMENFVYAATDKGLSFFNSNTTQFNYSKPTNCKITRIQINEKDTFVLSNYSLPHNIATISISYRYFSYRNAGNYNYKYRLKGLSKNWVYTNSIEARFTTLPPGDYEFEVYTILENNSLSAKSDVIRFTINKPFWETWWFILLILSIIFFIAYAILKYQIHIITKENKLKNQLTNYQKQALSSQMNPHFIFNSLNSIQLYILKNDPETSNKYLTKFATLIRSILNNSQEPLITLENEISTLINYIELEALRFDDKFEFKINIDSQIKTQEIKIPSLLIQPFVENAIWHGLMNKEGKGLLTVSISSNEKFLNCIIQDNGVGRKISAEVNQNRTKTHKSFGAKITQDRLSLLSELYKNELEIIFIDLFDSSGNATGTQVKLTIPILY